jgi:hypothetical protein
MTNSFELRSLQSRPEYFTAPCCFTRYLYDKTEVMHSLLFALLDRHRDEALFWTYELYFSGLEDDLVAWLRWIYATFYFEQNTRFTELFEINLSRLRTLPDQSERDCLVGTVVSNLVHRAYQIQTFTLEYLKMNVSKLPIDENNHPIFIRFRPRDVEEYQTVDICHILPRNYLQHVSRFPIRKNGSLFLRKFIKTTNESDQPYTKDCYLQKWLFYVSETRIWRSILEKYPGFRVNHATQTVEFSSDDELETFYENYGLEPDEQPNALHIVHGIDVYNAGIFTPMLADTFYSKYTQHI